MSFLIHWNRFAVKGDVFIREKMGGKRLKKWKGVKREHEKEWAKGMYKGWSEGRKAPQLQLLFQDLRISGMLSCLIRITNSRIHLLVSSITQHCNCVTIYPAWPIVSRNCCDFKTPTPLSFIQSTYSVGSHNCCYLFVSYLQNTHFLRIMKLKKWHALYFHVPFTLHPLMRNQAFYFTSPHLTRSFCVP